MSKRKLSFEEALKQLETLAEQIERGDIGLEDSIKKYEEGMALVQQCREILAKAEHKVQQLQERSDGSLEIKPAAIAREAQEKEDENA
jgi:exodeoxyribonuclease VII small subunit